MVSFSIITCTYNAAAVLERTLKSIASQTYPFIEHIIIDGVSKDSTLAIAQDYQASNSSQHSISIISERDNGLYDAMNKGIAKATGDYIVFMNAGDKFQDENTLNLIAKQIESCSNDDKLPGVVYGETNIVDDQGTFLRKRHHSAPEVLSWRSFKYGMLVCHQSFYALTAIAKATPYDLRYRFSADVDWCIRIMKECERRGLSLHNTHSILTAYLDGGMSIKNHRASLRERFAIMAHHYGFLTTIAMHIRFAIRNL